MRRGSWFPAVTLVLATAVAALAADLTLEQVPKPVLDAARARFKDAKVVGAADEKTPEGNLIYEITLDEAGKNIDMSLNPDGSIFLIEKEVARKDLPKPIAATVEKEFPKARYRLCEQVIEVDKEAGEKLTSYEVILLTTDKQMRAMQMDLEGKIMKVEKIAAEEADE
jgi:hypothetical protein